MRKATTYFFFAVATVLVVFAFLNAKTYAQLGIAVALYPLLSYFAFKIFPVRTRLHIKSPQASQPTQATYQPKPVVQAEPVNNTGVDNSDAVVVDIDRRAFLKLIGGTGLSIFIFSLLGRRVENLLFGQNVDSNNQQTASQSASLNQGSPTEGYRISEIDDNVVTYYGFTNKTGGWLIMREDTDSSSFRYARGEADFSKNWKSREKLTYDYFYNLE